MLMRMTCLILMIIFLFFQAKEYAKNDNAEVMVICAKIEAELATLSDEEKRNYCRS